MDLEKFNFSLKTKTELMQTAIMPSPLNKGNKMTEGTPEAREVITKLITERDTALPKAQMPIRFPSPSESFFFSPLPEKIKRISAGTRKE
jgi:hypothetical protein